MKMLLVCFAPCLIAALNSSSARASGASHATAALANSQQDEQEPSGLQRRTPKALSGYTLLAPLNSVETFLIDMQGEIMHAWGSEHAPSGPVYLLDNGNLMRPAREESNTRFRGGGIGGRLQEFSWENELLWDYRIADDTQTQHHDIAVLPNGNVLAIVWKHHSPEEVIAAGRDPQVVLPAGLWSDSIVEIRPIRPNGGEIVWQWNSWDHLIQDFDSDQANYGSIPEASGRIDINGDYRDMPPITAAERKNQKELERQMAALGYAGGDETEDDSSQDQERKRGQVTDWLHTNSVNYNATHDLIVLSTPHMNEIWVIDHSTSTEEARGSHGGRWNRGGDLLYRWGNPRNYGAGKNRDQRLYYQHDPQWLDSANNDLKLLIYNNGRDRRGEDDYSTVMELTLPFDPKAGFLRDEGKAYGPRRPDWEWGSADTLFSPFISGSQRLSNGNTFICEGASGRLVEVTTDGKVAWEYINDIAGQPAPKTTIAPSTRSNALFRATRVPKDAPALSLSGF